MFRMSNRKNQEDLRSKQARRWSGLEFRYLPQEGCVAKLFVVPAVERARSGTELILGPVPPVGAIHWLAGRRF